MANKVEAQTTTKKPKQEKLTIKEKAFCRYYAETGNGLKAIKQAGYKVSSDGSASATSTRILKKKVVQEEISRLMQKREKKSIMDAQEVMELFSAVARGEVKDQFGLEASLNDRLKAMNEIAKRTIDIDNKLKGIPDANVSIKLDWTD